MKLFKLDRFLPNISWLINKSRVFTKFFPDNFDNICIYYCFAMAYSCRTSTALKGDLILIEACQISKANLLDPDLIYLIVWIKYLLKGVTEIILFFILKSLQFIWKSLIMFRNYNFCKKSWFISSSNRSNRNVLPSIDEYLNSLARPRNWLA